MAKGLPESLAGPAGGSIDELLHAWREDAMTMVLRLLSIAAPIAFLTSLLAELSSQSYMMILLSGLLVGIMLMLIVLGRRMAIGLRSMLLIGTFELCALIYLAIDGLNGVGPLFVVVTSLLACLLLPRPTAIAVLVGMAALDLLIILLRAGPAEPLHLLNGWLVLTLISCGLGAAVLFLIQYLGRSLADARQARLRAEQLNHELERRVARRTAALEQALAEKQTRDRELQTLDRNIKLILRTIPEHFWMKDAQGRYLLVSDTLASFYGHSHSQMLGHTAAEIYGPELAEFIGVSDRQVIASGQADVSEFQFRHHDGGLHWFESSNTPVFDEQGAVVGVVGIARDISARKQSDIAIARELRYAEALSSCARLLLARAGPSSEDWPDLAQAAEHLRAALEVSRLAIYQYEAGGPQIFTMAEAVAPGDTRPAGLVSTWDGAPPELRALLAAGQPCGGPTAGRFSAYPDLQAAFDRNGIQSWLAVPVFVGGQIWGHISVNDRQQPREWDAPTIRMLATAADMISAFIQRQLALDELAASEAHLRALRDAIPDLLLILDDQGLLLDAHTPADAPMLPQIAAGVGRPLAELLSADLAGLFRDAARSTWHSGALSQFEFAASHADQPRTYEARVARVGSRRLLLIVRDVTERQRSSAALIAAKEAAEAADRAKSAFLAHMSHEIRTPLNAVIGTAELLRTTSLDDDQRGYIDTITIGGETLLGIVNNILDLARIESGRVELNRQPLLLGPLLDEVRALLAHQAERKGLALRCLLDPALPPAILGDQTRLRQVLINLLSNAVKFTDQGGVEVSVRGEGGPQPALVFEVSDTGVGIDHADLERIFAPFEQAERATHARYGGTGLGLTISRQLAELMGGQLTARSTPGCGTTMRFSLPLEPAPGASRGAAEVAATAGQSLQILVVEDNPTNQLVVGRLLSRLGHQVEIVEDGASALEAVAARRYDAIVMDVQLPVMDGVEVARFIRQRGRGVHQPWIIALTASALVGDRERYLAAGMDDYLSKPVRLSDLREALGRVPAAAPAPALDRQALHALGAELGPDAATVLELMVRTFRSDYAAQLEALSAAVAALDRDRVARLAHHLAGGSLQIGALAMAEACRELEHLAPAAEPAALAAGLGRLRAAFLAALAALEVASPRAGQG